VVLRAVGIVCFPGLQPLDVVGPHEVFAGATQALAASSPGDGYALDDDFLVDWIRRAAVHGRRITSVCTGSLLLAGGGNEALKADAR
jgi:putative intracellular protease/amidase